MERWSRPASLAAAVLFVVLFVVGFVLSTDTPSVSDSPSKVLAYYLHHQGRVGAAAYLIGLSIVFGLFWFGSLRGFLRRSEAAERLATVFLAGGVVFAVSGALAAGGLLALTDSPKHLTASAAQALNTASSDLSGVAFLAGLSVMWLASGLAIERSRLLPRWLGWIAIVLGVVAATPIGWFTAFAFVVWTVVVAVLVYLRTAPAAAPQA
jgi:hypothetical protein